jgi:type VI secretion system protein ImpF
MSLLDRLIDEAPELSFDPPRSRTEELRAIRETFRRDIEAILNTRRRCLSLEETIRTFEPRFRSVELSLVQARDPLDRVLRIRIEAVTQIEHALGPIVLETALDPATRTFSVMERDDV